MARMFWNAVQQARKTAKRQQAREPTWPVFRTGAGCCVKHSGVQARFYLLRFQSHPSESPTFCLFLRGYPKRSSTAILVTQSAPSHRSHRSLLPWPTLGPSVASRAVVIPVLEPERRSSSPIKELLSGAELLISTDNLPPFTTMGGGNKKSLNTSTSACFL